ncbi:MAG TPA: helix-turn-helix domain-containing protein [Polyangiaceae bacterium]|nr:helix-turn-helix domain-containing protein [Polyangiaceae bacterium]
MSVTNKLVRGEPSQCAAVDELVLLLGEKWTLLILGALTKAPVLRYNDLQRAVVGISQRMLTLRLKKLEENGLVKRTIFATVPPRVDYELTPLGLTLIEPMQALLDWTIDNRAAMEQARRAYAMAMPKTGGADAH